MNNRIIRRILSLSGAAIVLASLATGHLAAQPGPREEMREQRQQRGEGVHERREMLENALAEVELTDAQKRQIAQLQEEFRTESERIREEIRRLHEQAREQMQSGDEEGAATTREEIREQQEELREGGRVLREQVSMILTDEQKAQLKELRGAGNKGDARPPRPEGCPERGEIFESLNLTDAQKRQIEGMRAEFRAEHGPAMERMKELRDRMREQMQNRDREGGQETRERMREVRSELVAAGKELHERIETVLTDEQKELLKEHREEMEECRRQKKEEWKREGRGGNVPEMEDDEGATIE